MAIKKKYRTIIFYKDYFQEFFLKQRDKVRDKLICSCFFDHGQLVVLLNGFQKKTQKTPKEEIKKALKIKEKYENEKK